MRDTAAVSIKSSPNRQSDINRVVTPRYLFCSIPRNIKYSLEQDVFANGHERSAIEVLSVETISRGMNGIDLYVVAAGDTDEDIYQGYSR